MAKAKQAVPPGHYTVTPHLIMDNAARAIDWYKKAFGAEELMRHPTDDGRLMHASLKINGGYLMLHDDFPEHMGGPSQPAASFVLHLSVPDADAAWKRAIDAGAEDVTSNEDGHQILATPDSLNDVTKALEAKFGEPRKSAMLWKPQNTIALDDEAGEKILKLIESLDDSDDVQNVYANFEVSDALMQKMST